MPDETTTTTLDTLPEEFNGEGQDVIDMMRSNIIRTKAYLQRQEREATVKLKGFYCDWVLGALNLTK